jgi:diacylglycerol kinase family enzyme
VRAAVIVNPNAGALRRNPRLAARMRDMSSGRAELHVTKDDGHLDEVARALADRDVRKVAVVGGDGTASATLTSLWRAYGDARLPAVSLLRGGTMNTVANSLGVSRRNPGWLLKRTLRAWLSGDDLNHRPRAALRVGDRLGFLFGTGLMYGYLAEYYAVGKGQPTPVTAASVLARATASALVGGATFERILQPRSLAVRFEGGHWPAAQYLTIGAGAVAHAGLGFRPFFRAFERDGAFHLLAVKGRPYQVARDLPRVWLGKAMRPDAAQDACTAWAELSCAEGEFGYFIDGDLLTAPGRLSLGVGPRFPILCI